MRLLYFLVAEYFLILIYPASLLVSQNQDIDSAFVTVLGNKCLLNTLSTYFFLFCGFSFHVYHAMFHRTNLFSIYLLNCSGRMRNVSQLMTLPCCFCLRLDGGNTDSLKTFLIKKNKDKKETFLSSYLMEFTGLTPGLAWNS